MRVFNSAFTEQYTLVLLKNNNYRKSAEANKPSPGDVGGLQ